VAESIKRKALRLLTSMSEQLAVVAHLGEHGNLRT